MRLKLAPLLIGLLVVIVGTNTATSVFAWLTMREDAGHMEAIRGETIRPLQDLKALSDAYAVSVVDASHKIRNGNFTWQEGSTALEQAVGVIGRSWSALSTVPFAGDAATGFAEAARRRAAAEALVADLRRIIAARDTAALDALVRERLYAAIDPFSEAVGATIDAVVAHADREIRAGVDGLDTNVAILLGLMALAVGTAIAGAWVVLAQVTTPITRLTGAMGRLAQGTSTSPCRARTAATRSAPWPPRSRFSNRPPGTMPACVPTRPRPPARPRTSAVPRSKAWPGVSRRKPAARSTASPPR